MSSKISTFLAKAAAWLANRDNITYLIALAGFSMSLITALRNFITSREAYSIEVIDYAFRSPRDIQLLICMTNKSENSLSVIDISVFGTTCELYPKKILGKPENWYFRHTAPFPLCIPAHGCQMLYLEFLDGNFQAGQLAPGKRVDLEIRSTRKQVRKTVILGNESHYLHTRNRTPELQTQD